MSHADRSGPVHRSRRASHLRSGTAHRRRDPKAAQDARQRGGTGLGLAIVKELTNRLGGEIGFDSVTGHGSCFYLEFALDQPGEENNAGALH